MRIKLDENLHTDMATVLAASGVDTVADEGPLGADDASGCHTLSLMRPLTIRPTTIASTTSVQEDVRLDGFWGRCISSMMSASEMGFCP